MCIWARSFKTNDVVSYRFIKIANANISNMSILFVEKIVRSFCTEKVSIISSTKIISVLVIKS